MSYIVPKSQAIEKSTYEVLFRLDDVLKIGVILVEYDDKYLVEV